MKSTLIRAAEGGYLPDMLTRAGIRSLLRKRLDSLDTTGDPTARFLEQLGEGPIAVQTDAANDQHYEVPTRFFLGVLGSRLKYSSCYWPEGINDLKEAEHSMLELSCYRAELENGQDVLELGCGWGSLTLWMAEKYPSSMITAVSNSETQRAYIETQALDRGLCNVQVITADMNDFKPPHARGFDRVVYVEMMEHMRNHRKLFERIHGWLRPGGKMFIHIFAHQGAPYLFEDRGNPGDWMSTYFFSGGMMPAVDTLPRVAPELFDVEEQWEVNGRHYTRTLDAWLAKQDAKKKELLPVFQKAYGEAEASKWFHRWRMFWMACSELFAYNDGKEWPVMHYRFVKRTGEPRDG